MKLIHNDKVALGWAIFVELVAHGFFAFQAFLLGGFLGEIALANMFGTAAGNAIGSWALAIFMFGAAMQAFVLGEYMKEHVASYEYKRGDGSYMRSWKSIRWIVGGLELSSLAFRCFVVFQQGDYRQAVIVGVFGALLLYYAYAQAKVIHASVNRPVEYDVYRARQEVGRDLVKDVVGSSRYMTPQEKADFYTGDLSGAEAAQQRKPKGLFERLSGKWQTERAHKEEIAKTQQEEFGRSRDIAGKILPGYHDPFQSARVSEASRPSEQNGHRN